MGGTSFMELEMTDIHHLFEMSSGIYGSFNGSKSRNLGSSNNWHNKGRDHSKINIRQQSFNTDSNQQWESEELEKYQEIISSDQQNDYYRESTTGLDQLSVTEGRYIH
ncbi:hypothetical protein O181_102563 [Austropuccinia psidii MF-1]|uniref:Uncharacterized protein n=1 Tax=Austropuccinia psidii MF-1 TaxID=1389203 RepID=A0A9Q3PI84_9BASI|nr:hypothetical protein [Austropuccinia psidii MF-1]